MNGTKHLLVKVDQAGEFVAGEPWGVYLELDGEDVAMLIERRERLGRMMRRAAGLEEMVYNDPAAVWFGDNVLFPEAEDIAGSREMDEDQADLGEDLWDDTGYAWLAGPMDVDPADFARVGAPMLVVGEDGFYWRCRGHHSDEVSESQTVLWTAIEALDFGGA